MKKAAIYARYSSDNQNEESIDAQVRAIKEYVERNNIQIVKIYTDEALSATTADRPQFLQMVKDSSLGIFNTVIVHKLDRFARNRYDSAFYKRELKLNGVNVVSVLENLDDSPESIILESVLEGMAEYYSANLAREVMKGLKENAYKCKHTGGRPPLGYDVTEDKDYVINEREAESIKIIFSMYADGYGYGSIIDELNRLGYKTKAGKEFKKSSLHDILKNEKYKGVYTYNKTIKLINGKRNRRKFKPEDEIIRIPDGMPRIIDDITWERVKKRMDKNKRGPGSFSAKEVYLLSGIIYCGKCGKRMVGNRRTAGKNKKMYVSYCCSSGKNCDLKSINKNYIENMVIDELEKEMFSSNAIEKLSQKIYEYANSQQSEIKSDIKMFEKELKEIQFQIDNIVNAIANGMFHESMKEKMDSLEKRKSELNFYLNEARLQAEINSPSVENIKKYLERNSNIKNKSLDEQKKITQTYVKKITVNDDSIEVSFIVDLNGVPRAYQFKSTMYRKIGKTLR